MAYARTARCPVLSCGMLLPGSVHYVPIHLEYCFPRSVPYVTARIFTRDFWTPRNQQLCYCMMLPRSGIKPKSVLVLTLGYAGTNNRLGWHCCKGMLGYGDTEAWKRKEAELAYMWGVRQ
eukprot:2398909-Rhodomonas_salina.1